MKTVVIASQKGGVGKTTTAVTLAHGLALKKKSTMIIDLDSQGQVATALGRDHEPCVFNLLVGGHTMADVVRTTGRERLYHIPGDKRTATAQIVLNAEGFRIDVFKRLLERLTRIDFVVFDTAPSVGGLQEAAVYASDLVVVPCAVDFLASEGAARTIETLKAVQDLGWKGRILGVLPTFFDETTKESAATMADLRRAFGNLLLSEIHRATVMRECASEGKTVWEMAPKSRTAREYARLVWEVYNAEA